MLSSISFTFHFVIKCHYIQSINCFNFNLIIINRQDVTILYYYIIYFYNLNLFDFENKDLIYLLVKVL